MLNGMDVSFGDKITPQAFVKAINEEAKNRGAYGSLWTVLSQIKAHARPFAGPTTCSFLLLDGIRPHANTSERQGLCRFWTAMSFGIWQWQAHGD